MCENDLNDHILIPLAYGFIKYGTDSFHNIRCHAKKLFPSKTDEHLNKISELYIRRKLKDDQIGLMKTISAVNSSVFKESGIHQTASLEETIKTSQKQSGRALKNTTTNSSNTSSKFSMKTLTESLKRFQLGSIEDLEVVLSAGGTNVSTNYYAALADFNMDIENADTEEAASDLDKRNTETNTGDSILNTNASYEVAARSDIISALNASSGAKESKIPAVMSKLDSRSMNKKLDLIDVQKIQSEKMSMKATKQSTEDRNCEKAKANEIMILPSELNYEDFRSLTNIEDVIRNEIIKKYPDNYDKYLARVEHYIKKYYENDFVYESRWPKWLEFIDSSIITLDDINRVKARKLVIRDATTEVEDSNASPDLFPPSGESKEENNEPFGTRTASSKEVSLMVESENKFSECRVTTTAREEITANELHVDNKNQGERLTGVSNVQSTKSTNSDKTEAKAKDILIHPSELSYEDFRTLTNIENVMKKDIITKFPNDHEKYLSRIEKFLEKFYQKNFLCEPEWPKSIKFNDRSIRTLDDLNRVKAQNMMTNDTYEACRYDLKTSSPKEIEGSKMVNELNVSQDLLPPSGENGEDNNESLEKSPNSNKENNLSIRKSGDGDKENNQSILKVTSDSNENLMQDFNQKEEVAIDLEHCEKTDQKLDDTIPFNLSMIQNVNIMETEPFSEQSIASGDNFKQRDVDETKSEKKTSFKDVGENDDSQLDILNSNLQKFEDITFFDIANYPCSVPSQDINSEVIDPLSLTHTSSDKMNISSSGSSLVSYETVIFQYPQPNAHSVAEESVPYPLSNQYHEPSIIKSEAAINEPPSVLSHQFEKSRETNANKDIQSSEEEAEEIVIYTDSAAELCFPDFCKETEISETTPLFRTFDQTQTEHIDADFIEKESDQSIEDKNEINQVMYLDTSDVVFIENEPDQPIVLDDSQNNTQNLVERMMNISGSQQDSGSRVSVLNSLDDRNATQYAYSQEKSEFPRKGNENPNGYYNLSDNISADLNTYNSSNLQNMEVEEEAYLKVEVSKVGYSCPVATSLLDRNLSAQHQTDLNTYNSSCLQNSTETINQKRNVCSENQAESTSREDENLGIEPSGFTNSSYYITSDQLQAALNTYNNKSDPQNSKETIKNTNIREPFKRLVSNFDEINDQPVKKKKKTRNETNNITKRKKNKAIKTKIIDGIEVPIVPQILHNFRPLNLVALSKSATNNIAVMSEISTSNLCTKNPTANNDSECNIEDMSVTEIIPRYCRSNLSHALSSDNTSVCDMIMEEISSENCLTSLSGSILLRSESRDIENRIALYQNVCSHINNWITKLHIRGWLDTYAFELLYDSYFPLLRSALDLSIVSRVFIQKNKSISCEIVGDRLRINFKCSRLKEDLLFKMLFTLSFPFVKNERKAGNIIPFSAFSQILNQFRKYSRFSILVKKPQKDYVVSSSIDKLSTNISSKLFISYIIKALELYSVKNKQMPI